MVAGPGGQSQTPGFRGLPARGPAAGLKAARREAPATRNRVEAPRFPAAAAPPISPIASSFAPAKGHGQSSRNGGRSGRPRRDSGVTCTDMGDGPAGRATPSATSCATSSATDRRNPCRNFVLLVDRGVRSRGRDGSMEAGQLTDLGARATGTDGTVSHYGCHQRRTDKSSRRQRRAVVSAARRGERSVGVVPCCLRLHQVVGERIACHSGHAPTGAVVGVARRAWLASWSGLAAPTRPAQASATGSAQSLSPRPGATCPTGVRRAGCAGVAAASG